MQATSASEQPTTSSPWSEEPQERALLLVGGFDAAKCGTSIQRSEILAVMGNRSRGSILTAEEFTPGQRIHLSRVQYAAVAQVLPSVRSRSSMSADQVQFLVVQTAAWPLVLDTTHRTSTILVEASGSAAHTFSFSPMWMLVVP